MRALGSLRLWLVVVIAGAIGTIGGDVSPVAADPQRSSVAVPSVADGATDSRELQPEPATVTPGQTAPREWYMFYFKERRPLTLDVSRIAVFHGGNVASEDIRRLGLAAFGLDDSDVSPSVIHGRSFVATKPDVRSSERIESTVGQIAAGNAADFVSPVFVGLDGGPLAVTPRILVRFHDQVPAARAEAILAEVNAGVIADRNWAGMKGAFRVRSNSRNGIEVLDTANRLAELPEVRWAEPDMMFTGRGDLIPNDTFFGICWGLHNTGQSGGTPDADMDAPEAWDISIGDPSIKVLILDVGMQQTHPDINQVPGRDFTSEAPGTGGGPVNACDNHGTAVGGCVSAIINNNLGTVGVAPGTKVASARPFISNIPCNGTWSAQYSWTADALAWGESIGARVSNNSNSYGGEPSSVTNKYQETRDGGMVHFASAGNDSAPISGYPAKLPTVNSVAAMERHGNRASFSNYGPDLFISAPGQGIATTDRTGNNGYVAGDYVLVDGTSFASPYTAGVAALVLSHTSSLSPGAVEQILAETAVDLGIPGWDEDYGWGFVNAHLALLGGPLFDQGPDATGEDIASNIDRTDMAPNAVVADDFVSDGRPITAVRWWGSNLSLGAAATAAANSADQALRTRSEQPTGARGVPLGSTIINLGAQSLAQIPEEVRSRGVQHWNGGGLGGTAGPGSVVYDNSTPIVSYFPPGVGVILGDDMLLTATASELVGFDNVLVLAEAGADYDVTIELWTDDGSGRPSAIIPGTTCTASALPAGTTWTLGCGVAPGIMLSSRVWMMLTFSTPDAGWVITEAAEVGFTDDYFWLIPPGDGYWFGGTPYAGFAGRILAAVCGNGIVEGAEQCDPPDGITCDNNCQVIPNPPIDGWLVSFHEPLTLGGLPSPPLALYFCDATIVTVAATSFAACDAHPVRRYDVDLVDCCLLHSYADSRNGLTPGQPGAFLETECFNYDIDIQAVIGHEFVDIGGVCTEVVTGNTATIPFWGWHTTGTEHGLRPALRSMVSMSGPDWLYGPWANITPTCSAPNMAFQLLTDTSGSSGDCNDNGRPDVCESGPDCQPNGLLDECDIAAGTSKDCNGNGIPDECDIASGAPDCQPNGIPDSCELVGNDANGNGIPDECDPPG
ncbi:MAG: S8 family serine peptidase, partial [Planctomycetota bacterium]